jgi:hypothetical protein
LPLQGGRQVHRQGGFTHAAFLVQDSDNHENLISGYL